MGHFRALVVKQDQCSFLLLGLRDGEEEVAQLYLPLRTLLGPPGSTDI